MPVTSAPPYWTKDPANPEGERPTGLVVMLHGGKDRSGQAVDGRSASWRRSRAMQRDIADRAQEAGTQVWLLRFSRRGWNGGTDRIRDARQALADVREQLGEVPVCLLGHSMGARTAVQVADDPLVRGVVALAPWFPRGESIAPMAGKSLYAAHGSRDHVTSPQATADYVRRVGTVARHAELRDMGPVGHYLLRNRAAWNDFAVEAALRVLDLD